MWYSLRNFVRLFVASPVNFSGFFDAVVATVISVTTSTNLRKI